MLDKYKKYLLYGVGMFVASLLLRIDTNLPWYISGENLLRACTVPVIGVLLLFGWDAYKAKNSNKT